MSTNTRLTIGSLSTKTPSQSKMTRSGICEILFVLSARRSAPTRERSRSHGRPPADGCSALSAALLNPRYRELEGFRARVRCPRDGRRSGLANHKTRLELFATRVNVERDGYV